jgi:FixJ family two-component response regulator
MKPAEATVFVVDDDDAVCRALTRLIQSLGLRAQSYTSAQQFLDAYREGQPGCLVLDVRMPGLSGLELQEHLARESIDVPIIFITGHGDVPMSVRAMKSGALDFIQKPFNDQVLLDAIQHALAQDAADRRRKAERMAIQERFQSLTQRERQVLRLVVAGRLNKQIAAELKASEKTIKVHRGRMMKKMKANSVADLVRKAEAIGIGESALHQSPHGVRPKRS